MELRHLRIFIAAYEELSLTAAAVRVNATQPGLSVQIAGLEAELGLQLFERHARGIRPTYAARRLYPLANQILHDLSAAVGTMEFSTKSISGGFSLGLPPTLSKAVLASGLLELIERYPNIESRIVEAYSATLLPQLLSRELDCVLVTILPDHPQVRITPIYQDRFVLVSGPRLDLPRGRAISLGAEAGLKLVIPTLRYGLYRVLEPALRSGAIVPKATIEIDGLSGTLDFIEASDWAGLLPYAAVHNAARHTGLRINPIAGAELKIEYYLAQLASEHLSPAAQVFVDILAAKLAEIGQQYRSA